MITSVNTPAVNAPTLLPSLVSASNRSLSDASPSESDTTGANDRPGSDILSLSQPGSLATSDGSYERTSLSIRSRSTMKVSDEGDVRIRSQTKLSFRYEFESADGLKIRMRVKANLNYSQTNDDDGESQTTKLRAKAKISILQQNVTNGLAPLLDTPDTSAGAKSQISEALSTFNELSNAVTSLFLDSNPLDGESLIAGLVDAFNGLTESLGPGFLSPTAEPETVLASDVVESTGPVAAAPDTLPATEPQPIEVAPPVVVVPEPLPAAPLQEVEEPDTTDHEHVENDGADEVEQTGLSVPESEASPDTHEHQGPTGNQNVAPTTEGQPQSFIGSAMFKVRLQVIQSLNNLVGVFDTDSTSTLATQSTSKLTVQFAARYSVIGSGVSDATPQGNNIDAQV